MNDLQKRINELEREISTLPLGYISRKNIHGKTQQYYQWTEDGKKKSKYMDERTAEGTMILVEKRRKLQNELKALKKQLMKEPSGYVSQKVEHDFKTLVILEEELRKYVVPVQNYKKRGCYSVLNRYLTQNDTGKIFILYGLRRTGKTTLIRQAIADMSQSDFEQTAFMQVQKGVTLGDINADLKWFLQNGYRNVFIDEVTLAEDFIEGAALFSDIYAASGLKIVLSGTDSLGFLFSKSDELYDRCRMLHTTWIPYQEFEQVLGVRGMDEYIRYGGTMSLGGEHYNRMGTFESIESTDEYIDSAIASNIQHSLRYYQDGGHFRHLADLYEKNELTNVINRVVEDMNHRFTMDVLTKDFKSNDLGVSKRNLRKDSAHPTDILDRINEKQFTEGLRKALEIRNKSERTVEITDAHRTEIKEYLDLLDLTMEIPTEVIPVKSERLFRTVIAQPGLRYVQAEAFVTQLLQDTEFEMLSAMERARILERILNDIRGRMMEDIVLLETKMAFPRKQVFKLQFAIGEFDMVVADPKMLTAEIYEVKHSTKMIATQYKNLVDQEKCDATAFRFGTITKKTVIYRGESGSDGVMTYVNVEDYLRGLPIQYA